ncbi:uncharacterized protein N0V89_009493 [Didymosphaeria variabile]|uniref:Uncharacterized protein n=1 Tax=Didymosphaeria variabile TaxID=1932322 RepID=A0A9W8XDH1_9PLEO|nr:uncharacterized protein N0V89_009493 [Didymosphaeria variabile]KAJ4348121.1 hypothetical protein N0V89_009493 [Didymosphaeria variabile]
MDLSGGVPPPLFSFGALFGSRQPREPNWKYEPPSLKREEPLNVSFDFQSSTPPARFPSAAIGPASYPIETSHSLSQLSTENTTDVKSSLMQQHLETWDRNFSKTDSGTAATDELVYTVTTKEARATYPANKEPVTDSSIEQIRIGLVDNTRKEEEEFSASNDSVFDFVSKRNAVTEDNTMSLKNVYLQNEELDAVSDAEQGHSDQVDNSLETWARDDAEGHAQLFEALSTEEVVLETTEDLSSDFVVCFEKFRQMTDGTSPDMFEQKELTGIATRKTWRELMDKNRSRPDTFLVNAYLTCCPSGSDAGSFCLLVFQYLSNSTWAGKYTLGLLGQPAVRLPSIFDSDGLRFLEILEQTCLAPSMPRTTAIHLIYKKLATQIQSQPVSSPSSYKVRAKMYTCGSLFDRDASLRLLIRGLWDSAHWSMKHGKNSPYHQNKRIKLKNNQGEVAPYSSGMLLRRASYGLSDHHLAQRLRKTWSLLSTDYQQAPLRLSNLIAACVRNNSMIPPALDYLDLVPQSLLRAWIAESSVTLKQVQTIPQPGQKRRPYMHIWFKLFYRLDMRRNAGSDDQASLCQFAFSAFVRAHFEHRYPPSTLIIALLYGLLGHDSFTGKSSIDLFDWIESYTLFLAQQEQKGASVNGMLAKLISDLANKSLPNHGVLELIIPYIDEYKSFHSVSNLLERISKSGTRISNTAFLDSYMDRIVEEVSKENDSTRLGYNLNALKRLLNARRALGITTTQVGVRVEELQSRRFFNHILTRANDAHIVPLAYRNITTDIPKEVQADLIHQFAHQYAMDRTRSCQQTWRSIRYLYLYLKIHELPIQPTFTRAIVSVCITRPLAENRFVAQKKAVWVCRLVAQVEGEEVARQVEQYFWAWRGDLILRAKRGLIGLGAYESAHISTMERLELLSWNTRVRHEQEDDVDTQEHGAL